MPRARKSIELHRLQGTTPQYAVETGPTFKAGRPKMPKDLTPIAEAEWRRMVKQLTKRGTLTSVDSSALEVYARMFAQWRGYCEEVNRYGEMVDDVVLDKNGESHTRRVQNPAAKLALQLGNALRQYQKEFSATPASRERTRPAVPERKPEANEEFLSV